MSPGPDYALENAAAQLVGAVLAVWVLCEMFAAWRKRKRRNKYGQYRRRTDPRDSVGIFNRENSRG